MQTFFCKLVPPRATFVQDLTPAEMEAMGRHAAYWKRLIERGTQVFALGLVLDPAGAFGVGIVEAEDMAAMRALTEHDPAITSAMGLHYEIHPIPRGVMHSAH
ncbi:MAG TPA: YciI family protein [Rhodanobacteraceae bacterium]|nr:YciI family protein [Rhodanobacteraceae bacterium]